MTTKAKRRQINNVVNDLGIHLGTWSPGDGVTRYRFSASPGDYFSFPLPMYTALGASEALTWCRGLLQGYRLPRQPENNRTDKHRRDSD